MTYRDKVSWLKQIWNMANQIETPSIVRPHNPSESTCRTLGFALKRQVSRMLLLRKCACFFNFTSKLLIRSALSLLDMPSYLLLSNSLVRIEMNILKTWHLLRTRWTPLTLRQKRLLLPPGHQYTIQCICLKKIQNRTTLVSLSTTTAGLQFQGGLPQKRTLKQGVSAGGTKYSGDTGG